MVLKRDTRILDSIFQQLNKNLLHCKEYVIVIDDFVMCVLCYKLIPLNSKDLKFTCGIVNDHLNTIDHVKRELELMPNGVDKLFNRIKNPKNSYHKIFFSKNQDGLFCNLCNIFVDDSKDELNYCHGLNCHLNQNQIHKDLVFQELTSYLPDNESVSYLILTGNQITCELCLEVVLVTSDLENTGNKLRTHILGATHCRKLNRKGKNQRLTIDDTEFIVNEIFTSINEVNRKYMMMHKSGKLFCQLCNCFLALVIETIVNHVEQPTHVFLIEKGAHGLFMDESNKINGSLKLIKENENFLKTYCIGKNELLNSEVEFRPLYIEGEENFVYNQLLTKGLLPELVQIIEQNREFIHLKDKKYICSLCFVHLDHEVFFEHLNGNEHMEKEEENFVLFPGDSETDENYEHLKLIVTKEMFPDVEKNLCYIRRTGNVFTCTLCSACFFINPELRSNSLKYFVQRKSISENFVAHFNCKRHQIAVENCNESRSIDKGVEIINDTPQNINNSAVDRSVNLPASETELLISLNDEPTVAVFRAYKKLYDVFNSEIPELIKQNIKYFVLRENFLTCVLCSVDFEINKQSVMMENILSVHLVSKPHMNRSKVHLEQPYDIEQSLSNNLINILSPNVINRYLTEIFGSKLFPIIEQNKTVLLKQAKGIVCVMCDYLIDTSQNPKLLLLRHFHCTNHKSHRNSFMNDLLTFKNEYLRNNPYKEYSELVEREKELSNKTSSASDKMLSEKLLLEISNNAETEINESLATSVIKNSKSVDKTLFASNKDGKGSLYLCKNTVNTKFDLENKNIVSTNQTRSYSVDSSNKKLPFLEKYSINDKLPVSPNRNKISLGSKATLIPNKPLMTNPDQNKLMNQVGHTKITPTYLPENKYQPATKNCIPNKIFSSTTFDKTSSKETNLSSSSSNSVHKYLGDVFGPDLPKIIDENKNYLSLYKKGCLCNLCDVVMIVSPTPGKEISNFSQHLQSYNHKENLKFFKRDLRRSCNNNKSTLTLERTSSYGAHKSENIDHSKGNVSYVNKKPTTNDRFNTVMPHKLSPVNSNKSLTTYNNQKIIAKKILVSNEKLPPFRDSKTSLENKSSSIESVKNKAKHPDGMLK